MSGAWCSVFLMLGGQGFQSSGSTGALLMATGFVGGGGHAVIQNAGLNGPLI